MQLCFVVESTCLPALRGVETVKELVDLIFILYEQILVKLDWKHSSRCSCYKTPLFRGSIRLQQINRILYCISSC